MKCEEILPELPSFIESGGPPQVEVHLAECESCRTELESIRRTTERLTDAFALDNPSSKAAPRRSGIRRFAPLVAVAMALFAVGLMIVLVVYRPRNGSTTVPASAGVTKPNFDLTERLVDLHVQMADAATLDERLDLTADTFEALFQHYLYAVDSGDGKKAKPIAEAIIRFARELGGPKGKTDPGFAEFILRRALGSLPEGEGEFRPLNDRIIAACESALNDLLKVE